MKKTTITTNTTTTSTSGGSFDLSLARCDTGNIEITRNIGASEDLLEQRLNALATTAATLGVDGLNYAISRAEQMNRDLVRLKRGKELQARPPAGYGTVGECVVLLSISERTLRRWLANGDLVPVRIGERVFIELEKVRKLKGITTGTP